MGGQRHAPAPLPPNRTGTGGWMGSRADLDGCGKNGLTGVFVLFSVVYYFVLNALHLAFCFYCTSHTTQTSMPPLGFEPAILASDRPQTLALDRSATGIIIDSLTVCPVTSRYTDWAIAARSFFLELSYSRVARMCVFVPVNSRCALQ
jgi:hypothetical protein